MHANDEWVEVYNLFTWYFSVNSDTRHARNVNANVNANGELKNRLSRLARRAGRPAGKGKRARRRKKRWGSRRRRRRQTVVYPVLESWRCCVRVNELTTMSGRDFLSYQPPSTSHHPSPTRPDAMWMYQHHTAPHYYTMACPTSTRRI